MKAGIFAVLLLFVTALFTPTALELDRAELQDAGEADIDFENYEGPVERIDSREAIRGIGRTLGEMTRSGEDGRYNGRYLARRILGSADDPRRAADIIELTRDARVDHIVNLRRIVAGYLESAWGYSREDADLIGRFVTLYNAVHRGNIGFFSERYRSEVVATLSADKVGLATSYREWAGRTQLLIPIRVDRLPGDLDAVDPAQLIDREVISELRTRRDLGIEDRKAIIAFIERVIEERREVIAEERAAIEEEQAVIDARQEEIAREQTSPQTPQQQSAETEPETPQAAPEQPVVTPSATVDEDEAAAPEQAASPAAEPTPQPVETPGAAAAETAPEETAEADDETEELVQREEQLQERREALEQEEEELEALTEEVEQLYQETAEDQATVDDGDVPREIVPFVIARGGNTYELSVVDLSTVAIAGEQTIPVATRDLVPYQGGLLVAHAGNNRLLFLDSLSLEIKAESQENVVPGGKVLVVGQTIFTVVPLNGGYFVGEFDSQLVLLRRSSQEVSPNTDIVHRSESLLLQGADGELKRLELESFR